MSRTRQVVYIILAGIFSGLILPDSTAAQQVGPPPREIDSSEANAIVEIDLHALQLTGSIDFNLDGQILEEFWSSAVPISDFTQQEPVEGGVPSEETEIRVVFDEDNLYIGVIIYDDPEEVLAYQRERDATLSTDDRFMWILDTFLDGRTGYFFEINAAGLMGDGILRSSGGSSSARARYEFRWWQCEQGVGRYLGGTYRDASRRMVRRDPDPFSYTELRSR